MLRKYFRRRAFWIVILLVLVAINFLLPFGLFPRPPFPNCGPEHWRWLDARFTRKQDVIAYFQAHQLELISGSQLPKLVSVPEGTAIQPLDVGIDWQALEQNIQIQQRIGYRIFSLRYEHPLCPGQYHTFRVTSYGLASLYGCCGI